MRPVRPDASQPEASGEALRVLHADDDRLDRLLVHDLLENEHGGFQVVGVGGLAELRARLADWRCDVVVTDFEFPTFDGLAVLEAAHAADPDLPVVVLTGSGSEELAVEALRHGASDYVTKGHLRRLPQVLLAAVERRRLAAAARRAQAELDAARERSRSLLAASPAVVYTLRAAGSFPCTFVSENVTWLLGHQPADFTARAGFWREHVHPDDLPDVLAELQRILERGHGVYEYRFRRRDGSYRWMRDEARLLRDAAGQPAEVVGSWSDVTERNRMEEALRAHARRLETLHAVDRAILAAESPAEIAGVALAHVRRLTGCSLACLFWHDLSAETATVLAVEADRPTRLAAGASFAAELPAGPDPFVAALTQGEIVAIADVSALPELPEVGQAVRLAGVRSTALLPLLSQGKLVAVLQLGADRPDALTAEHLAVAREVADQLAVAIEHARLLEQVQRHTAELEERVAERTAQLAETNAELNAFARSVSHDLRAPLRAVRGFAELLLEDYGAELSPEPRSYAERIVAAAERMDTMILDILTYSRTSSVELVREPVDLGVVLADVLAQLDAEVRARGAAVEVVAPLPRVLGQRAVLTQALANLVGNALKFAAPGVAPRVRVRAEEREDRVRLWVEDNGIGIAPEDQADLFRPFSRLHSTADYPGTGLGLAIVRKGVERLGGRVGLVSAVGEGSQFWIELPSPPGPPPADD